MYKNKEDEEIEKSIKDSIEILDGENDFNLKRWRCIIFASLVF